MNRLYKSLSLSLFVLSLALLATGLLTGSDRIAEARSTAGLHVVELQNSFGEVIVGGTGKATFTIVNPTANAVRILGAQDHCGKLGCISASGSLPVLIPAGGRFNLPVLVYAKTAGVYADSLSLYTDCPRYPEMELMLTGSIIDQPRLK